MKVRVCAVGAKSKNRVADENQKKNTEANSGIVRHFKQFLKLKTSALDDFWDFMVSKALQNQNFAKICSKIKDFEDNAPLL